MEPVAASDEPVSATDPQVAAAPMRTGGDSIHLRERGLWNDPGSGRFVRRGWSSLKWLLNLSSDEQRLWERATELDGSGRAIEVLLKRRHRGDIGAFDPLDVLEVYGDGHRFRGKVKVRDRKSGRQFVVPWADIKKVDPVDRDRQIDLIAMPPGEEVRGSGSKEWFEREIVPYRWFHMTDRSRLQSIAEHGIDPARGDTNSDPSVLPRPGTVYIANEYMIENSAIWDILGLDEPVILEIDPNQLDYTRIVPDEDYFTLAGFADPVDFGLPPWNQSKREGPGVWARRVKLGEQPGIMEATGLTSPTPSNTYGYGGTIPPEAILRVKFDASYDTETKSWSRESDWMSIGEALQRIDDREIDLLAMPPSGPGSLPVDLAAWDKRRRTLIREGYRSANYLRPLDYETAVAVQGEVQQAPIMVHMPLIVMDSVSVKGLRGMTDPLDPSPGGDNDQSYDERIVIERLNGMNDGVVYGVSGVQTEMGDLAFSPESASAYGDVKVTLSDAVKRRAYFTPEDSLFTESIPLPIFGDLLPEQVKRSFVSPIYELSEGDYAPYIEVQIPGRVPVREFAAVDIETELPLDRVREIARNLRDGGMDGDGRLSIGGKDFTINELADDREIDLLAMPPSGEVVTPDSKPKALVDSDVRAEDMPVGTALKVKSWQAPYQEGKPYAEYLKFRDNYWIQKSYLADGTLSATDWRKHTDDGIQLLLLTPPDQQDAEREAQAQRAADLRAAKEARFVRIKQPTQREFDTFGGVTKESAPTPAFYRTLLDTPVPTPDKAKVYAFDSTAPNMSYDDATPPIPVRMRPRVDETGAAKNIDRGQLVDATEGMGDNSVKDALAEGATWSQQALRDAGFTHVVLYRGIRKGGDPFSSDSSEFRSRDTTWLERRNVPVDQLQRPSRVTSWSANPRYAAMFGDEVVKTVVPVEQIVSMDVFGDASYGYGLNASINRTLTTGESSDMFSVDPDVPGTVLVPVRGDEVLVADTPARGLAIAEGRWEDAADPELPDVELADDRQIDLLVTDAMPSTKQAAIASVRDRYKDVSLTPEGYAQGDQLGAKMHSELLDLFDANEPTDADIWTALTETIASRQMVTLALLSDNPDPIAIGVLQEAHRQIEAELPDGETMDVWRTSLPDRDPFDSDSGPYSPTLRDDLPATGVTSWWGTRPADGLKPESDWRIVADRESGDIGLTDDSQDKFAKRKANRAELTVAADRIIGRLGDMRHSGELLISRDTETVDRLMTGQFPIVQGDSDRAARIQRLVDLLTDPPERQIDLLVADTGRRVPDEQIAVYPTSDPEPTLPGEAEAATMPVLAPAEGSVLTATAKMSRPTFREVVTGANTDPDTVVRARAVTQATQDELARVGIDNVVLYRGVPVDEVSDPFRFKPSDRISSNRRSPVMRPASGVTSWTTDKRVAAKYGQRVVKAVVPRELILSWDGVGAIAAQGQVDSPDGLLPGREVLVARSSDLVDRLIGERQIDLLVLPSTGSGFRRLTDDAQATGSRFQPSDFADADAFTAATAGLRDTMSAPYSGGVDSIEIQPSGKRETLDADLDVQAAWLASFPVVESLLDAVQSDDDLKELLSAGSALESLVPQYHGGHPWQEAVELVRSEYLSRRESIDDLVARQLLYEYNMDWANSSQSIKSQWLMESVVEMLGASVTDDYPEWDEFRKQPNRVPGTQSVEPSRLDRVKARIMALSIYTLTQRTLAEQGLAPNDAIVLARGSSEEEWKAAQLLPSNKNMLVRTNPLSAMSTNSRIAANFGSARMALRVPVSHIFSTAHTGPGTYLEEEVIGIGPPEGLIGRTIEPADYTKVVRDDIVEALQQVNADTPFEVKNWVGTPRGAAGAYATLVEPPLSDRWRRPDGSVDAERVGAVRSLFEEGGFVKLVQANEQLDDPSSLFVEPRVADGSLRWPVTIEDGDMLPRQTLFDGQRVWAVNSYNGIVHSVDSQFQTTTEITVPGGVAEDRFRSTSFSTDRTLMAFDGASLWVLQDDGVRAIDPTTGNVGTHIPVDDPVHVVANDKSVFVFDRSGDVTIVDAATQEITDRQHTGVANIIKVKFNRDYPLVMGRSEDDVPVWTQVFPGTSMPPTVHEIPQLAAIPELETSGYTLDIAADYESGTVYVLGYRHKQKTGSPPSNFEHLVLAYDEADGSLKQTFEVSSPSEIMMVSDGQLHLLSRSPAQVSSSYISPDGQIENKHWNTRVGSSRENANTIINTGDTVSAVVRDPEEETVRVVPLTETNQVNNSRTQSAIDVALTAYNADKLFVDDFAEVLASDPMFDDIVLPLLNAYPAEERPAMMNALTDSIHTSIDRFFTDDVRNLPNFESFKSRLATKVAGDLLQRQPVGRDRLFEPGDLRARGPHTPFEEYEHRRFRPDHVNQETAIYAFSSDRSWPSERWPDSVPHYVTHHSRGTYAEAYPNHGSSDVQNHTNGQPFTIVTPAINGQVWYHRIHHSARDGADVSPADDSEFGVLPDTPATSKIVDLWNKADQRAWRATHELARLFLDLPEDQWPWPLPTDPDWQIADDREAMRNRIGAYGLFATVTAYMSKWRNLSPKDFLDKLRALLVDEYGLPAEDFDSNLPAIKAIIGKAQDIVRTADTESQDFEEEANRLLDEILGPPV